MFDEKTFREYINEKFVTEAFDTSHTILKKEFGNPDLYYIEINKKEYRIFIEKAIDNSKDLHIGFEYFDGSKYITNGITNLLEAKEILGLFGTILVILKTYNFNNLMFCSDENKKFRTYIRMMQRLAKEFNIKQISHNDKCIFAFNVDFKPTEVQKKFKYKGNK